MDLPLFRTDLVCKAIDADGQRMVDVTDPDSGSTFRFYELEYAIACAMDGTRDLAGLAEWAHAELGIAPDSTELETVVSTLGELGYLGALTADVAGAAPSEIVRELGSSPHRARTAVPTGDEDVELGAPGKSKIYERAAAPHAPVAPLELGLPGKAQTDEAYPSAKPAAALAVADSGFELGAPGKSLLPDAAEDDFSAVLSTQVKPAAVIAPGPDALEAAAPRRDPDADPSTDLSHQFQLTPDGVKEAVRQSRVMQAVEAPADEFDEEIPTAAAAVASIAAKAAPALAGSDEVEPITGAGPIALEKKKSGGAAIVLPEAPRAAAATATATEAAAARPPARVSTILILVVALAILGAAAAYVYLTYFKDQVGSPPPPRKQAATRPVPEPVKPVAPPRLAKLVAGEGEPVVVAATQAGAVAWLAEKGAALEAGAPLAKLGGSEAVEKDLAYSQERAKFYQDRYDQAAAKNDRAGMKAAEANVKRKQADVVAATAKLATLVVAAPVAGVVEPSVALRARVAIGAELATITPVVGPRATFAGPARAAAVGAKVEVSATADATRKATCEVVEVAAEAVTISCPPGGALGPGDEVALP